MIVAILNSKGGVGKSTIAVNMAAERARAGFDVWLVDGDRQGTSEGAMSIRANDPHLAMIACSSYPEGRILREQVLHQKSKYDDIVIDAGGRDSTALRAALSIADVVVMPFQPRSYDVWAMTDMAKLVDEAFASRSAFPVYAVLNNAEYSEQSADNADAVEALAEYPQFTYLATPLCSRKAFARAASAGMSVFEFKPEGKPRDEKAMAELASLINAIF